MTFPGIPVVSILIARSKQLPRWMIVIAGVVVIGGGVFIRQKVVSTTAQPQYQTSTVQRGTLISSISGSGQVATTNSTTITTQASGVVAKIFVQEGQLVKAGAPIAKLDLDLTSKQKAQQALANYQSAKNQVAAAQANMYSLQSKLFAANQKFMNGAVVQGLAKEDPNYIQQDADWLASESNYKTQQAVINQAQLATSQAWMSYQQSSDTIYAPISGTVSGLGIQIGSVIAAQESGSSTTSSTKIANITTNAKPTIKVNLTEIDVPKIKIGNKATVTLDALPDKSYVGKVVSVDTVGLVSSGVTNYPVIIQLDDMSTDILPNMAATANIILETRVDALSVPTAALQGQTDAPTVRVLNDGKIVMTAVTVGLSTDTAVEITQGLQEGQTIVTGVSQTSKTSSTQTTSPFSTFGNTRGATGGLTGGANRVRVP